MRACVLNTVLVVTVMLFFTTEALACKRSPDAGSKASADLSYTLLRVLPHAADHFTQGLVVHDGRLIESSGRYGVSALIEERIGSTAVLKQQRLPDNVFAEGLAMMGDTLYQLSWREQQLFIWDRDFRLLRVQAYEGEGWGLTSDGQALIMSDGSDRLYFRDPHHFAITRTLHVRDGSTAVSQLNELESVRNLIFANVWFSDRIAVIDPDSGAVCAWLDLSALRAWLPGSVQPREAVLNGMAYDADKDRLYVTGKLWPRVFELRLGPLPESCRTRNPERPSPALRR